MTHRCHAYLASRKIGRSLVVLLAAGCLSAVAHDAYAQDQDTEAPMSEAQALYASIEWDYGPTTVSIGANAEMDLPEGYQYTGREGARKWNELTENPPDDDLGILMPTSDDADWFVVFSFSDIGYVPDDEKEDLDADAILESIKAGAEASNEYRRSHGWAEMHVTGWMHPPAYDEATNNLVWATRAATSDGGEVTNYNTRILGRRGVMSVVLVASPDELSSITPTVKQLLGDFRYKSGEKYGEWVAGDKVAAYGLAALVTGGAAAAAAKTGLLGKLGVLFAKAGKAIILFVVAAAAGLWKFLAGRGSSST